MPTIKKRISGVDLRAGFHLTSQALGFPPGKQAPLMADIAVLVAKWRSILEVEIYTKNYEFQYGRIKSSRFNAAGEESEHYATYFHTRAKPNAGDPLLIISFDSIAGQDDFMFIETITDHNIYFGSPGAGKTKAHVERRSSDLKRRIENGKKTNPQTSSQTPEVDKNDDVSPDE
ncbi:hypothetical protein IMY97_09290 [Pectobacterium versatile]|uniref:hypothetical protein n=1 Tax=Pectobacterium versatile TaxID=2488639 RepID=UPI001FA78C94|nr:MULTISPECIES: hypothetical protein [Pectobacterium]MBK4828296.1 hypothetical protein [Pectobacterium carotovorum subsp. carotovorum]QUI37501.2 hypothetical protein IMY97_09290 [Pectobacterium versatile]